MQLWAYLGECEIWKAGLQTETLDRSWPWCLETEFLPPLGRFCSSNLHLTGRGQHGVEGGLLSWSSDDGCEPHSQNTFTATSRWVFGWITEDWPSQAVTQNWPSLYLSSFCFEKNLNICTVITAFCSPLGFALMYIIFGEQSCLGKRGFLLKILTCKMPSPDLWSSGVWGLAQT